MHHPPAKYGVLAHTIWRSHLNMAERKRHAEVSLYQFLSYRIHVHPDCFPFCGNSNIHVIRNYICRWRVFIYTRHNAGVTYYGLYSVMWQITWNRMELSECPDRCAKADNGKNKVFHDAKVRHFFHMTSRFGISITNFRLLDFIIRPIQRHTKHQ